MEEVIEYVLNHFGIQRHDLKPSLRPKPVNHKARIILAKFLKDKDFVNSEIQNVLFTHDVSVIYYLMLRFDEKKYPELDDLLVELHEKFKETKGTGPNFKALKFCLKCKQSKLNHLNFRKVKKGRYYHLCFTCEEINSKKQIEREEKKRQEEAKVPKVKVPKPPKIVKPKVVKVKVAKPKEVKEKPQKVAVVKVLKSIPKKQPKQKVTKIESPILFPFAAKTKELQKITDFKAINDQREQELFSKGTRFVKSTKHIRAYVLPKTNN